MEKEEISNFNSDLNFPFQFCLADPLWTCQKRSDELEKTALAMKVVDPKMFDTNYLQDFLIPATQTIESPITREYAIMMYQYQKAHGSESEVYGILRKHSDDLKTDLEAFRVKLSNLSGAGMARIADLYKIEQDVDKTQERLVAYAKQTKQQCIAYQESFDWLLKTHTAYQKALRSAANDEEFMKIITPKRFHFGVTTLSEADSKKFAMNLKATGADRVTDLTAIWERFGKAFDNSVLEMKDLVTLAAIKASATANDPAPLKAAQDACFAALGRIQATFNGMKQINIAQYKANIAITGDEPMENFQPSTMPDAEVTYILQSFLQNRVVDNAFAVFNN